jgi:cell wall-associated NlpC family hydrolase
VVKTSPLTDGLSVTVHMDGATKSAPQSGTGTYTTANWDITTLRSPKTVYATCPTAVQSGNATVHFKKNRQVAVWAPDYIGCAYVSGNEGPCETGFGCSGFQWYMYTKVGYTQTRTTAQGQYNASTHVAAADALPGDWIFFDWGSVPPNTSSIDHTGVYRRTDEYGYRYMVDAHDPTVREQKLTSYYTDHGVWGHRYSANERY